MVDRLIRLPSDVEALEIYRQELHKIQPNVDLSLVSDDQVVDLMEKYLDDCLRLAGVFVTSIFDAFARLAPGLGRALTAFDALNKHREEVERGRQQDGDAQDQGRSRDEGKS